MNRNEYQNIASEIKELQLLLAEIPAENIIDRMSLECRLNSLKEELEHINQYQLTEKIKLTFRGDPVWGTHGIMTDFASGATAAFNNAIAAISAGMKQLNYMGPIPEKQENCLLITGTTTGSFGFEFELPLQKEKKDDLIPEHPQAENALIKIQELFQLACDGTDDELSEIVDEIHPRAIRACGDFLSFMEKNNASCAIEFNQRVFRFVDVNQVYNAEKRLQTENIREETVECIGSLRGALPGRRTFELQTGNGLISGKISPDIEDVDNLNRNFILKEAKFKINIIYVGQSRPKYTLMKVSYLELNQ